MTEGKKSKRIGIRGRRVNISVSLYMDQVDKLEELAGSRSLSACIQEMIDRDHAKLEKTS